MFSNTDQSRQLYIPDFKLWTDYYEKKVSGQKRIEQNPHSSNSSSDGSKVQVKLISPIAQTTDQAESIMKTDGKKIRKGRKNKKQKTKSSSKGKVSHSRKKASSSERAFSYRKLKDIFSKGKK